MNQYFKCNQKECFGCTDGVCTILTAPCGGKKCPFFKTESQMKQGLIESELKQKSINLNEECDPVEEAYSIVYKIFNTLNPEHKYISNDMRKVLCLLGQTLA